MDETKTILITGATDGIGLALAREYAAAGWRVLTHGRRPAAALDDPLFADGAYCQADLEAPDCAGRVRDFLAAQGVARLDVLVHNAGLGYCGRTADQAPASIDALLQVNLAAPIALTHALLPHLQRAHGRIVCISSVVAGLPGPDYSVYTASKAALEGFARSLRVELGEEIGVQVLRPGATRTGMHAKMGLTREQMAWDKFPAAEQAARRIAQQINGRPSNKTIGAGAQLLYAAGHYGGGLFDHALRLGRRGAPPAERARTPLVCAITGAADGIGRALARRFAGAGYRVVGIDVDAARARAVQAEIGALGGQADFIIADLTTPAGIATVVAALEAGPPLDVLIHNAGISHVARFAHSDPARQQAVLDLNLRAPLQLTPALLRAGALRPGGSLGFIASLSTFASYPGAAVYAASKDGLAAYARSLRVEYPRRHVLTVYPGPTRTAHARRYSPDNRREGRRMAPEKLAEGIYTAVQQRRGALIPGPANRLMAVAGYLFPGLLEWSMRKAMLDKLEDRVLE